MNDELLALISLQDTDQETRELRARIAALPARLSALEQKLAQQKSGVEAATRALKDEEATRRRLENDLKDIQQKIKKFRDQASSVKTNEQFHALQHEISFAESEVNKIEDRELESMERSDKLASQLKHALQEFADHTKVVELEKEAARKTVEDQQKRLAALVEDRARLRSRISESQLEDYDRISSSRGAALSRAADGTCLACRMALRPQLWNQIRSGELVPCESCGRLLYFDSDIPPVA